jgi:hypothetical protein
MRETADDAVGMVRLAMKVARVRIESARGKHAWVNIYG